MPVESNEEPNVYEMQHKVWPGWANGDFGAHEDAEAITRLLGDVSGDRLLDLGCGSGRLSCAMAQRGWRVLGIDVSVDLINRAMTRAGKRNFSVSPLFQVADIRSFSLDQTFDLIVLWDSVLAIWPWEIAQGILTHAVEKLVAPGGWVIVGQLNPKFFAQTPDFETSIDNPTIGPGRTHRRYRYDAGTGLLLDDVSVVHKDGEKVVLPTQKLHLVEATEIATALGDAGCERLVISGSDGWRWPQDSRNEDHTSAQFIVLGQKI